ncbi:alpha/beta hydrolase-fold protein [Rhodocytophaga aerolata]|uniref:Alpha/beta hydrolase-fold protein n=1 Tax=Rhodocytophaga aerolata TaxID=455078 RepID=A0ABT8RCR1_9BACT|nr:alpha/beta hydrolase-fold protein [Rhodocytophaga aerolata]MDO1449850.1 alpha/beta hydrolase-fold protein [Rhodocytophaga aerolata]
MVFLFPLVTQVKVSLIAFFILILLFGCNISLLAQLHLRGHVIDVDTKQPLAYVNIGIKVKNKGTTSLADGSFSITIPPEYATDTLTFSLVGYHPFDLPISKGLPANEPLSILLKEKTIQLGEVNIRAEKLAEKKYGIKRRNLLLHFTDGMFESKDIFEIAQVIKLGNRAAQITSLNLHINAPRADSASFRINFYKLSDGRPAERIIEKSILQRHPIKPGWLKFDLQSYHLQLNGNFVVSIEFIPEPKENVGSIYYEVKLGGTSRSFYRRNSLGQWNTPPHHYCMYVTAVVDKNAFVEEEDQETAPTLRMHSAVVNDSFSLFIRLPRGYERNKKKNYPVIYQLDANAYFDQVSYAVGQLSKKGKLAIEPIIVGIGYANAYVMDSLRIRDYTFPQVHSSQGLPMGGGGDKFYTYITTELIPYIDTHYRTDTNKRTLMGHSLGGYFTLYSLWRDLNQERLFNAYVAASPSLAYADFYLIKAFEMLPLSKKGESRPEVYMTMGEMEMQQDVEEGFKHLDQMLNKKDVVELKTKILQGVEHMSTAIPSFEEGIELMLIK